jgi:hypothetical protein
MVQSCKSLSHRLVIRGGNGSREPGNRNEAAVEPKSVKQPGWEKQIRWLVR